MKRKVITISLVCVFFVLCGLMVFNFEVEATKNHKVAGWAWSENIGWLSLNCYNEGLSNRCMRTDYGVDYDKNLAELFGWAWSEYGGWVCFGRTCHDYEPGLKRTIVELKENGLLNGWGKWLQLRDDGWIKFQGKSVQVDGAKYSCRNCYTPKSTGVKECAFCFGSSFLNGSKELCQSCSSCRGDTCQNCDACYEYGVALDYSTNSLVGWAWNGEEQDTSYGWLHFNPSKSQVTVNAPYLETIGGDIYAREGVGGLTQSITPDEKYNATYMIQSNGDIVHFDSDCTDNRDCSSADWVTDEMDEFDLPDSENNYVGNVGALDIKGLLAGQYGKIENISTSSQIDFMLGGKVYYSPNDLHVYTKTFRSGRNGVSGAGTVVVRGDLYIHSNQGYYTAYQLKDSSHLESVGWMVLKNADGSGGNVYILPKVTTVVGSFYAENSISTGTYGGSRFDSPLQVMGLLVSKQFNFERQYADLDAQHAAEKIIYDGRVIGNPPSGFADLSAALPVWTKFGE
jgi:hypothetical protein